MLRKLRHFSVLFFIFTLVVLPYVSQVLGDESEAMSRISQAEDSLEAAYLSLLEAERSGGDISKLVALLNTALEYRSEAERALILGEYDEVISLAGKVVETSNVVIDANINLKVISERFNELRFWNQLFLSIGVVCSTILLGFLGWRRFKGYYLRMMMARPEALVDES